MIQGKFCKDRTISFLYGKRSPLYRATAIIPDDDVVLREMKECVEEKLDGIWLEDASFEAPVKNAIGGFFLFPNLREYYITKESIVDLRKNWFVRLKPFPPTAKHRNEFLYNGG